MSRYILIIDDDEGVRDAFSLALGGLGYEVAAFANGPDGIAAVRERRPDLILLDLRMRGMNGVEVMRVLRSIDPGLSIYIVTAFHSEYMNELRAAADDGLEFELIAKPLDADQIRQVVGAILPLG